MDHRFLRLGAILGFLGVALGAFGTHSLRGKVPDADLVIWGTAVQYQTLHAVALLAVAVIAGHLPIKQVRSAGWCFLAGVLIFSGSLYTLVLSGVRVWGAVTPIGGVCLLSGWLLLAFAAGKSKTVGNP